MSSNHVYVEFQFSDFSSLFEQVIPSNLLSLKSTIRAPVTSNVEENMYIARESMGHNSGIDGFAYTFRGYE